MPRTKAQVNKPITKKSKSSSKSSQKSKSVHKQTPKQKLKTKTLKTIRPKRKSRSILVDVIEDEPMNTGSSWLAVDDDLKLSNSQKRKQEQKKEQKIFDENDNNNQDPLQFTNTELDSQKKFFSNLSRETKNKQESEVDTNPHKRQRRITLYRRLVFKFIVLVAIVAAVVSYFSFSKLTVTLNLKGENINGNLLLKVVDNNFSATSTNLKTNSKTTSTIFTNNNSQFLSDENDPRETIKGTIKEIKASVFKNYPSNGEKFLGNEIIGRVDIINNYNRNQPLVATTRLLSPNNKLYRIKNSVNVPAGGQVAVDIYTTKPQPNMAIGPTTFTIPGLWVGLQDKIYAQSEAPFTYRQKIQKYVNASDLSYAAQDINKSLIVAAKAKAKASLAPTDNWLYVMSDPAKITINAKVGDKKSEFSAQATGKIIAVSFPRSEVAKLAASRLRLIIPNDKDLADFNPVNIIYNIDSYNPLLKTATVRASFTGTMILKSNASIISPKSLEGLTAKQISTYLNNQSEISSYTLKFSPSFIRRAPYLVDRIRIKINKN